ncbi:tyrosine-type recombinase/integrase [Pseudoalteromonas sp. Cn5-37]|uniref:tyrosine-type recombinase/integrase n=1 Tax=Pseudoalteromonas sp. Cn5-37 TaxID=2908886 RepID=UPI001F1E8D85|nr:integrase arm-type DNA-binding domain-containing protein [Pseudoalteromonas sp. Cn5-37]MCF2917459.1 tyrosine-type recombinase/integrase [Pseudoalteromonas sp. Cn5-37]
MNLTNERIKALKCPEGQKQTKKYDGNNLYLLVKSTGSKLWRYKYKYANKHKEISLGRYPKISLKMARSKADEMRLHLIEGIDPSLERKIKKYESSDENLNFGKIAQGWLNINKAEWSESNYKKLKRWLENDLKDLCKLQVHQIKKQHLIKVIKQLVDADTKRKVSPMLSMLNRIFRYAITNEITEHNPLINLDYIQLTGKMPKVKHHAGITDPQKLGQLILKIENNTLGTFCPQEALKLLPHLFLRPSELRCLQWKHVIFDEQYILIPAEDMKTNKEHIVPLSIQTFSKFKTLYKYTSYSKYVFPSEMNRSQPFSKNVINNRLKALGYSSEDIVAHGFRGVASTLLNEQEEDFNHIEIQLAHNIGNQTSRSYNHAQYLSARRAMMQRWSDFLDKLRDEAELNLAADQPIE